MKRTVFKHRGLPYLLVLPQVVVTLVFFIWPAFESLRLSVYRTSPFGDKSFFVGLENFAKLLASPEYYQSILAQLHLWLRGDRSRGGRGPLRGGARHPEHPRTDRLPDGRAVALRHRRARWPASSSSSCFTPPTACCRTGSRSSPPTISTGCSRAGWPCCWSSWPPRGPLVGYNIAFFLAGLLAIPTSVLEAASVDGAGSIRRFLSIVLPLLSPITFYLVVVNLIFCLLRLLRRHRRRHPGWTRAGPPRSSSTRSRRTASSA